MLGPAAAQRLGIDHIYPGERIWLDDQWFYPVGHPRPVRADAGNRKRGARRLPGGQNAISASTGTRTRSTCAPRTARWRPCSPCSRSTADPEAPNEVDVSQPSATLTARADAQGAFNGLFLGLGAVALLVGAVGVANIMVISVLERRSEIGLRRALGATKGQIRLQFLCEAILLSLAGGAVGIATGILATAIYASTKHWAIVIPTLAWAGGFGAALLIGAIAGLLPAIRAARLSPTEALRTV